MKMFRVMLVTLGLVVGVHAAAAELSSGSAAIPVRSGDDQLTFGRCRSRLVGNRLAVSF